MFREGFLEAVAILGLFWRMDKAIGRAEEGVSAAMGSMGKFQRIGMELENIQVPYVLKIHKRVYSEISNLAHLK